VGHIGKFWVKRVRVNSKQVWSQIGIFWVKSGNSARSPRENATKEELGHHDDEYADEEASVDSTNACPKNFTLIWETGKFKTGFHPNTGKPRNKDLTIITER
jgi:hypothetical protein